MTINHSNLSLLIDAGSRFLSGNLDAAEFIKYVDAFVGNDMLETMPEPLREEVSSFQDEISLFTRDENLIKDYPEQYFGITELREKTATFLSHLGFSSSR